MQRRVGLPPGRPCVLERELSLRKMRVNSGENKGHTAVRKIGNKSRYKRRERERERERGHKKVGERERACV